MSSTTKENEKIPMKEKIIPINLLGLKDGTYYTNTNKVPVNVSDGVITCVGTTGDSVDFDNVTIPLVNSITLDGTYNFSIQNIEYGKGNTDDPVAILIDNTNNNIDRVYGVADSSYKIFNTNKHIEDKELETNTVTVTEIRIALAKNQSFNTSFNLMLQEGEYRKVYVPYNNVDKIAFWAEYGYDVINPRLFCAVGNGEADDTKALQDTFDYAIENKMKIVLDREATYLVSTTLKLEGDDIFFDGQGATIVMSDLAYFEKDTDEYPESKSVIYIKVPYKGGVGKTDDISDYNDGQYFYRVFENVKIDCNVGKAITGINILDGGKTKYSNIMICDPVSYGIYFKGGHEAVFDNIHAVRSKVNDTDENGNYISRESVGMMIIASDIYVHDCVILDFKTGIRTSGGDNHFARCHVWVTYTPNIISESISFDVPAGYSTFTQCIADSTRYGWVLRGVARVYLSNCCNAYNKYYDRDTYGEPVLFYFDKSELTGHYFKGETLYISSSHFKTRDGLNCHFDNLTEYENPIIIDKLNCQTFKDVHISEAVRTNDLRGIGLINNK